MVFSGLKRPEECLAAAWVGGRGAIRGFRANQSDFTCVGSLAQVNLPIGSLCQLSTPLYRVVCSALGIEAAVLAHPHFQSNVAVVILALMLAQVGAPPWHRRAKLFAAGGERSLRWPRAVDNVDRCFRWSSGRGRSHEL